MTLKSEDLPFRTDFLHRCIFCHKSCRPESHGGLEGKLLDIKYFLEMWKRRRL